ncbi:tyrosine-type recombinase/integrase [Chromobacterium sp. CV08]|uniref:tyrosine-type recombinase/integrase n=1 Tax=Chromobacterium sp. CV08 TaxID=3133274 RepID=UPI003DAA4DEE
MQTHPLISITQPDPDVLTEVVKQLPRLPSSLRYYDELEDVVRSIPQPESSMRFEIIAQGRQSGIDFSSYDSVHTLLLKHVFAFLLAQDLSPLTVLMYFGGAPHLLRQNLEALVASGPTSVGLVWTILRAREMPESAFLLAKSLLRLLAAHQLQGWSNNYANFLAYALPLPTKDKYASVRSGDAFLLAEEEALIVRYLDQMSEWLRLTPNRVNTPALCDTGMLLCAYQFAMRPIQIAMVKLRDVRVWNDDPASPSVHLTFYMAKQKSASKTTPMTRKVKREWSVLIKELYMRRRQEGGSGKDRLFDAFQQPPGPRIAAVLEKILPERAAATDLRHTAAQRLVDAGASQEELAEFMGHSDITTGLVYYRSSANQAELVNKALGLSDIYTKVARIAHDKFISSDELADLKDDQQIAGVPHGISIAGIGGCSSGQPLCPSNPILACYGCHKFMPVHEIRIHEQVLSDFRGIVLFFHESSRGDKNSPAYLQLQHTISSVEAIIEELRGDAK